MITEDYCSFETAKLLKEKGFDEVCHAMYNRNEYLIPTNFPRVTKSEKREFVLDAPTLQMAMKWLREEKNIIVNVWYNGVDWNAEYYNDEDENFYLITDCVSDYYEDAVESALKYCLKNLI